MTGTTEELKPSDVLDHAATLIDEWGWHRGDLIDAKTGAMCHSGAIGAAAGYNIHRHSKRDGWVVTFRQEGFESALCAERWDIEAIGRGGHSRLERLRLPVQGRGRRHAPQGRRHGTGGGRVSLEPVFSLHQPWASLLFTPSGKQLGRLGFNVAGLSVVSWHDRMVKEWETRPNACPASKLGVRVWIASTQLCAPLPHAARVGDFRFYRSDHRRSARLGTGIPERAIETPLGAILGSVVFTESMPITAACLWSTSHVCRSGGDLLCHRWNHLARTEHDISDQVPYGDWTPGRHAWRVTEATPLAEPYPFKGGRGWSESIDPALLGVS